MVEAVEGEGSVEVAAAVLAVVVVTVDAVVLVEVEVGLMSDGKGNKVGIVHFFDSAVNVC